MSTTSCSCFLILRMPVPQELWPLDQKKNNHNAKS
jgi:hypothetical protein